MSKLTKFLKLFQYEPEVDEQKTFNITEALNNNWDKVDAELEKWDADGKTFTQHVGNSAIHITDEDRSVWDGKADGSHNHNTQYAGINHNHTAQDVGAAPANHNHDGRYATAAQGTKADAALPRSGGTMTGGVWSNAHLTPIENPQFRNISFGTGAPPSYGIEGAVHHQYK